jgi:hypothetical protein
VAGGGHGRGRQCGVVVLVTHTRKSPSSERQKIRKRQPPPPSLRSLFDKLGNAALLRHSQNSWIPDATELEHHTVTDHHEMILSLHYP